jgi:2-hydroxychromene-2-carboxylate isomerase
MKTAIDFYFDFSSPYGYLAGEKIDALAAKHGRSVNWRPMLLGAAFKLTGGQPLPSIPIKGEYAKRDFPALGALPRRGDEDSDGIPDQRPRRLSCFLFIE